MSIIINTYIPVVEVVGAVSRSILCYKLLGEGTTGTRVAFRKPHLWSGSKGERYREQNDKVL